MSDMEAEDIRLHSMDPAILFPDFTKLNAFQPLKRGKATQGNDKRRKQKDPKKPLSLRQKKPITTNAVATRKYKNVLR
ncbi:hypothetical protein TNCV_5073471 [Trichonephila clavipes]|nr:hypothetical protein TNCV_5073471 [Trichonephila clavipes]